MNEGLLQPAACQPLTSELHTRLPQVVCGSKYLVRGESARDHVDLLASSRHWPPVYVVDMATPVALCADLCYPELTSQMWGKNQGCFSSPTEPAVVSSLLRTGRNPWIQEDHPRLSRGPAWELSSYFLSLHQYFILMRQSPLLTYHSRGHSVSFGVLGVVYTGILYEKSLLSTEASKLPPWERCGHCTY